MEDLAARSPIALVKYCAPSAVREFKCDCVDVRDLREYILRAVTQDSLSDTQHLEIQLIQQRCIALNLVTTTAQN